MTGSFRPAGDEYAPFYAGYVEAVGEGDPMTLLKTQMKELESLLDGVDEERGLGPYAPGKWSVKEVLVHLIDAERVFSTRALRFARGDETPVPGYDENAWAPASRADRRTLADILDEVRAVRAGTVALFRSLEGADFRKRGIADDQPVSVRALLWIIPGHMAHHLGVLRDRYGLG